MADSTTTTEMLKMQGVARVPTPPPGALRKIADEAFDQPFDKSPTTDPCEDVEAEGYAAFGCGAPNPYHLETQQHRDWWRGYMLAKEVVSNVE